MLSLVGIYPTRRLICIYNLWQITYSVPKVTLLVMLFRYLMPPMTFTFQIKRQWQKQISFNPNSKWITSLWVKFRPSTPLRRPNHRQFDCLFNNMLILTSKKTPKRRITTLSKIESKCKFCLIGNVFWNVICKMMAILFTPQCVKWQLLVKGIVVYVSISVPPHNKCLRLLKLWDFCFRLYLSWPLNHIDIITTAKLRQQRRNRNN